MIKIKTNFPIALESPDYIQPWGTKRDNSVSKKFNKKLFRLFGKDIKVLDLGCAGGGFVKSILKMGGLAVGIEGSDYSLFTGRAEWRKIPDNLFTADIAKPFEVEGIKFNVITLWEVLEHIKEEELPNVFENISNHLEENGFVIGSISTKEEEIKLLDFDFSQFDKVEVITEDEDDIKSACKFVLQFENLVRRLHNKTKNIQLKVLIETFFHWRDKFCDCIKDEI